MTTAQFDEIVRQVDAIARSLKRIESRILGWTAQGFELAVEGTVGDTIRLDAADSLNAWAPLDTNTLTGPVWNYTDVDALLQPRRFYRAVRLP